MLIKTFIARELDNYEKQFELGIHLHISSGMLSKYKKGECTPPLSLARQIYAEYKEVIWPYSLAAVQGHNDDDFVDYHVED